MNQQLQVDPEALRILASELCGIADDAARAVDDLRTTIAAAGACWGDDQPGRSFERYYLPGAQEGMQALESSTATLRQVGGRVAGAADSFETEDLYGADRLQYAEGLVPGGGPGVSASPSEYLDAGSLGPDFGRGPYHQVPAGRLSARGAELTAKIAVRSGAGAAPLDHASVAQGDEISVGVNDSGRPGPNGEIGGGPGRDSVGPAPPIQRPAPAHVASVPRVSEISARPETRSATRLPGGPPNLGSGRTPWSSKSAPMTPMTPRAVDFRAPAEETPPRVFPPRRPAARRSDASTGDASGGRPSRPGGPSSARPPKVRRVVVSPWRAQPAATAPGVMRLADEMASRHGLRITGFAAAGLDEPVMCEIAAALDRILDRYHAIDLRCVEIAELAEGAPAQLALEPIRDEHGSGVAAMRLLLDRTMVTDPAVLAEVVRAGADGRNLAPGSAERPVYSTVVRELGRALDYSGGLAARRTAQRALIAEYCRRSDVASRHATLGRVVRGYRHWRGQLSGCASHRIFVPGTAVAEAFTEVELGAGKVGGAAAALHRLLVESANNAAVSGDHCSLLPRYAPTPSVATG